MQNERDLTLATRSYAKDNPLVSWWHILSTLGLLAVAMAGTLLHIHPLWRLCFSVLTGLLLLRFFVIYHDQQHHAILPKSRSAEVLMQAFGIYALSPSSIWRSSHNHHHQHNSKLRGSHIGSFPIMTKSQFLKSPASTRFKYLFVRHPLTILFGYVFMFVLGMCVNPLRNDPRRHLDCLASLVVHLTVGILLVVFAGWRGLVFFQTIPQFVASAVGSYLFYAQHNFPGVAFSDKNGWTHEKAALESSSFMRTNRIMAWFTGNIGYHHIHHLNAKIPFYRLPEVMRKMPGLQNARVTSLHPLEILRCLRLKVWDVDEQQMVGLRQLAGLKTAPVFGGTETSRLRPGRADRRQI